MDNLKLDMYKCSFDGNRELFVQKRFVTIGEYSFFKSLTRDDSALEGKDISGENIFDVSFIDAASFCNYLSELEGFGNAYDVSSNPVNPAILDSEGYRLFTAGEWLELVKIEEDLKSSGVKDLKGVHWQLTETERSLPYRPDGSGDVEHPEFIWSYRVVVGGSGDSSEKLMSGDPIALLLGYDGNYKTCFRVVRGNAEQNAAMRRFTAN